MRLLFSFKTGLAILILVGIIFSISFIYCGCGKEKSPAAELPACMILMSGECPDCVTAKPIFQELKDRYSGRMVVLQFDIDTEEGAFIASKSRLTAIPTLIYIDPSGAEIGRIEGDLVLKKVLQYTDAFLAAQKK